MADYTFEASLQGGPGIASSASSVDASMVAVIATSLFIPIFLLAVFLPFIITTIIAVILSIIFLLSGIFMTVGPILGGAYLGFLFGEKIAGFLGNMFSNIGNRITDFPDMLKDMIMNSKIFGIIKEKLKTFNDWVDKNPVLSRIRDILVSAGHLVKTVGGEIISTFIVPTLKAPAQLNLENIPLGFGFFPVNLMDTLFSAYEGTLESDSFELQTIADPTISFWNFLGTVPSRDRRSESVQKLTKKYEKKAASIRKKIKELKEERRSKSSDSDSSSSEDSSSSDSWDASKAIGTRKRSIVGQSVDG